MRTGSTSSTAEGARPDEDARLVAEGNAALDGGSYAEARERFEAALAAAESAEALEGLGHARRWLGDNVGAGEARDRAYRLYRERGDRAKAAGVAVWMANDAMLLRGDDAVADGWFARAHTLLEQLDEAPERGWLAIQEGTRAFATGEDAVAARDAAELAIEIGQRWKDPNLEYSGRALHGLALVYLGEVVAGMADLDEASAAASAGEVPSAPQSGVIYCHLIFACERVRDIERANQWCDAVRRQAERIDSQYLFGYCRSHYAGVLTARGEWDEAERELVRAAADFDATAPAASHEVELGMAELHRRRGDLDAAEETAERNASHPKAQLCLAEIAWDRGDLRSAADLLERRNRHMPEERHRGDLGGLDLAVRIGVAGGDAESTTRALEALTDLAEQAGSTPIRATASYARGIAAPLLGGERGHGQAALEDAIDAWASAGMPYETARARLALARTLEAEGRGDAAEAELNRVRLALAELGAESDRIQSFDLPLAASPPGASGGVLTARETEILRLVADGLGDNEIAARLYLSPHTVHRHVANIRTKLRQPSRAAAAAQAARDGLI